MLPFHRALGLPPGPVVSAQGAVVRASDTGAVWSSRPVAAADVAEVTRDGRARGFAVQHYRDGGAAAGGVYSETRTCASLSTI